MEHHPNAIVHKAGVGEATVATLVRDHPQTGELDTLPEPERKRRGISARGRGEERLISAGVFPGGSLGQGLWRSVEQLADRVTGDHLDAISTGGQSLSCAPPRVTRTKKRATQLHQGGARPRGGRFASRAGSRSHSIPPTPPLHSVCKLSALCCSPVREPDSRRTSRREQLQELKGDEPERVDLDEVEGEVSEGLGVRALEQVRREALAQAALRDLLAWLGDGRGERRALDSGGRLGDDRSTTLTHILRRFRQHSHSDQTPPTQGSCRATLRLLQALGVRRTHCLPRCGKL